MDLNNRRVLVTGGASFIGSHLVEGLLARGATVRVVDDLTVGSSRTSRASSTTAASSSSRATSAPPGLADRTVKGADVVFHLAADHGGRGYVDRHQAACATNLALDGIVFLACRTHGVEKIVYASSGCVYPNSMQTDPDEIST